MSAREEFFVGFLPTPPGLRRFLLVAAAVLIAGFGALGWLSAVTQDDPGAGRFRGDIGPQTVSGVLELLPYPILHVTEGTEHIPAGRTLMMSGGGKIGVADRAGPLVGKLATASGFVLARGDLAMLQVQGGAAGLGHAGGPAPAPPAPAALGRWRLAGEMCDGKCYSGAMHPGRGLAHKACAALCVSGGVPPVFVSTKPVEGSAFFLMAGPDGGPLTAELRARIGAFVTLEGEVERRGDLMVLKVDPATVRPL